jgi:hypothetical protein
VTGTPGLMILALQLLRSFLLLFVACFVFSTGNPGYGSTYVRNQ